MLEHVNIEVLANWVAMLRAGVEGAILLSDDNEEARFYQRCIHDEARVVPAAEVALSLLEKMEERGIHGLVATARGVSPPPIAPNVFQPSVGDVASLLLTAVQISRS